MNSSSQMPIFLKNFKLVLLSIFSVNPLQPCVTFLYPLKISENLNVFSGYRKATPIGNGLKNTDQDNSAYDLYLSIWIYCLFQKISWDNLFFSTKNKGKKHKRRASIWITRALNLDINFLSTLQKFWTD